MILKSSFSASGKLVISGEHSVLYGYPAISMAIHQRLYVKIKAFYSIDKEEKEIIVLSNKFGKEKFKLNCDIRVADWCKSVYFLCKEIFKDDLKESVIIEIISDIDDYGYGSSGAVFVSVSASLYKYVTGKRIRFSSVLRLYNKYYQYEDIKPSGIDIATSYCGGIVYYNPSKKNVEKIDSNFFEKLDVYAVYSGKKVKTKDTIKIANEVKDSEEIYKSISEITEKIKSLLLDKEEENYTNEEERYKHFFDLIIKNQQYLENLKLCDRKIQNITNEMKKKGFVAKISGSGLGDSIICFRKKNNNKEYKSHFKKILIGVGLMEEKYSLEDNIILKMEKEIIEKEREQLKKKTKDDVLKEIFNNKKVEIKKQTNKHFSPINLALIKYWGKLNNELNLSLTPSVSITSTKLGTITQCFVSKKDELFLNGKEIEIKSNFYNRVFSFIDLFRYYLSFVDYKNGDIKIRVETSNNFPTASGMASSASGFCALTYSLCDLFGLDLNKNEIAMISRIGSGSACRSIFGKESKFVKWVNDAVEICNFNKNFSDDIGCIVLLLSQNQKTISSRTAMEITQKKSKIYYDWVRQTEQDFDNIFNTNNFDDFGTIVENNSLSMHKIIQSIGIDYFNDKTRKAIEFVKKMRKKKKISVYLTIDAGANVFLIFNTEDKKILINSIIENGVAGIDSILDF